ncbi:MAG: type II CAAX endopeptidase family protein [Candidatus Acidiferrales bacterium]
MMHSDFALILIALAVAVPILGRRRVRQLIELPDTNKMDRLSLYASTLAFQWLAAAIVLWRTSVRGIRPSQLGLVLRHPNLIVTTAVVLAILFLINQLVSVKRIASQAAELRGTVAQLALKLFPRDDVERLAFFALVATVAVCEEIIYRGFAQYVFENWSRSTVIGVFASAILFSLAHLYQGRRGLASTFTVGILFSGVRAWTGSLIPSIAAHFVADLTVGLLAPSRIRAALATTSPVDSANGEAAPNGAP